MAGFFPYFASLWQHTWWKEFIGNVYFAHCFLGHCPSWMVVWLLGLWWSRILPWLQQVAKSIIYHFKVERNQREAIQQGNWRRCVSYRHNLSDPTPPGRSHLLFSFKVSQQCHCIINLSRDQPRYPLDLLARDLTIWQNPHRHIT